MLLGSNWPKAALKNSPPLMTCEVLRCNAGPEDLLFPSSGRLSAIEPRNVFPAIVKSGELDEIIPFLIGIPPLPDFRIRGIV
jgi:hypothetical protein